MESEITDATFLSADMTTGVALGNETSAPCFFGVPRVVTKANRARSRSFLEFSKVETRIASAHFD